MWTPFASATPPFAHWDAFFAAALCTMLVGTIMTNLVIPFFMRRLWPARYASLSIGESCGTLPWGTALGTAHGASKVD